MSDSEEVLSRPPTDLEIRKHVLPLLGKEWRAFCCYLGVKHTDMKKAEMCYPGNVDEVIFTCIKKWLNGSTGSPVTWEFLLRILEESELKEPSAQLKAKLLTLKGVLLD